MKTYRWLTLVAALLITVCELLVFTSESGRDPQQQPDVVAATRSGTGARSSLAGMASVYWAVSGAESPERVR